MSKNFSTHFVHLTWSTKDRFPWLGDKIRSRLWRYLVDVCREYEIPLVAVGGHEDHVHILVRLPLTMSAAQAVKILKGCSSQWLERSAFGREGFAWQPGYSVFSVPKNDLDRIAAYIGDQDYHHRESTYLLPSAETLACLDAMVPQPSTMPIGLCY